MERGMGRAAQDPLAAAQTVATLRVGQEVDGVFACSRKERQMTKAGSPYLTVELRDRTGAILARAFRDADLLAGRFERGELVRVRGRVESFREQPQIELQAIARVDAQEAQADLASFLPVARRDLEELEGFLEHLAREVYDPGLRGLLERMLGDRSCAASCAARLARFRAVAPALLVLVLVLAPAGAAGAEAAVGVATTPISVVCWSTPWRWPRWRLSCARCISAWTATCCSPRPSCTIWVRRASSPTVRRSSAARRGGC